MLQGRNKKRRSNQAQLTGELCVSILTFLKYVKICINHIIMWSSTSKIRGALLVKSILSYPPGLKSSRGIMRKWIRLCGGVPVGMCKYVAVWLGHIIRGSFEKFKYDQTWIKDAIWVPSYFDEVKGHITKVKGHLRSS